MHIRIDLGLVSFTKFAKTFNLTLLVWQIAIIHPSHRNVLLSVCTRLNVSSCQQIDTIHPSHQKSKEIG
jgi:hypothetical protein